MGTFFVFLLTILGVLLSGCVTNNLYYEAAMKQPTAEYQHSFSNGSGDNPIKIHMDYVGNIYPKSGFPENYAVNRNGRKNDLEDVFLTKKPLVCDKEVAGETEILCQKELSWEDRQLAIWNRRAEEILAAWEAVDGNADIVFLVHGFNVNDGTQEYESYRRLLIDYHEVQNPLIFVEIHWDGLFSLLRLPAWPKGQYSGHLVGFKLRQLFNMMDDRRGGNGVKPRIRFITHSSGAFVTAATFGNSLAAFPNYLEDNHRDEYYAVYFQNRGLTLEQFEKTPSDQHHEFVLRQYRIPNMLDFRAAMFAAATSTNSFAMDPRKLPEKRKYDNIRAAQDVEYGWLDTGNSTLGFTVTKDDWALNKVILWATAFGASTMGREAHYYCDFVEDTFKKKGVKSHIFNFDRGTIEGSTTKNFVRKYLESRSHSMNVYLRQPQAKQLVKMLFEDKPANLEYEIICPETP